MIGRRTFMRGASVLPIAVGVALSRPSPTTAAERRLAVAADRLTALQAHADRHAAGAALEPDDPYTLAVAEIDLVAAGMAGLPADTMGGVLLKLRAMQVPIVADDDEAHGLALSICRDLRRLHGTGGRDA